MSKINPKAWKEESGAKSSTAILITPRFTRAFISQTSLWAPLLHVTSFSLFLPESEQRGPGRRIRVLTTAAVDSAAAPKAGETFLSWGLFSAERGALNTSPRLCAIANMPACVLGRVSRRSGLRVNKSAFPPLAFRCGQGMCSHLCRRPVKLTLRPLRPSARTPLL